MTNISIYNKRGRSFGWLLALSVFCMLSITSIRSYGQTWPACDACPTTIPPTTVAWTSGSVIATLQLCPPPAPACNVKICYCYRQTSTGNNDITISSIMIDNSGGCADCNPDLQTVVDQAFKWILDHNPMGFPCPPCPTTTNYWSEIRGQCWQVTTVSGIKVYKICGGLAYCNTKWRVCCDPITGAQTRTKTGTVVTGTCDAGCLTVTCP